MMKKLVWIIAATLLLTACGTAKQQPIEPVATTELSKATYPTVDLEEIEALERQGAMTIDVREVYEYEEGHLVGAINIPLSELQNGERAELVKDQKYVVVCRSGNRSQTASDILFAEGYDVVNVSEGMSTWQGEISK